jgi:rare lipoprotein A
LILSLLVAACGTQAPRPVDERGEASAAVAPAAPARDTAPGSAGGITSAPAAKKSAAPIKFGGGYKDDGPGDGPAIDPDTIPDAVPRPEPLHRFANNPYSVFGRDYVPLREIKPYKARGIGSWYGRRYHGQKTSSGEIYDMYAMTAAHPVLPIPSYVRVTNPANGKSVVVRVNDRGPFHAGREIDLSWTAAWKLGYVDRGSTLVQVESILPGQVLAVAPPSPARDTAPGSAGGITSAPLLRREDGADPIAGLAAAEPEPPLPQLQDGRGHFLQLGAFGNRDNAEALRMRLARELGELSGKLVVQASGGLFRVQLGPWPNAAAAQLAGVRLRESFGMAPMVVQR